MYIMVTVDWTQIVTFLTLVQMHQVHAQKDPKSHNLSSSFFHSMFRGVLRVGLFEKVPDPVSV